MAFLDFLFGSNKKKLKIQEAIQNGALLIDVRTASEYKSGCYSGSKNIPLDKINNETEKLKKTGKPVITVCASGMRSGVAASQLRAKGINAINGGAWNRFDRYL